MTFHRLIGTQCYPFPISVSVHHVKVPVNYGIVYHFCIIIINHESWSIFNVKFLVEWLIANYIAVIQSELAIWVMI